MMIPRWPEITAVLQKLDNVDLVVIIIVLMAMNPWWGLLVLVLPLIIILRNKLRREYLFLRQIRKLKVPSLAHVQETAKRPDGLRAYFPPDRRDAPELSKRFLQKKDNN